MSGAGPAPRLFALPPGADFAAEFVRGLLAQIGHLAPERQARVVVFANSSRMLRAIRAAFDHHGTRLLPRLRLVTDLATDAEPQIPPPVPRLRRRLELARLVAARVAEQGEFPPGAAVFDLAESLARLLAEMQDEGLPDDRLDDPGLARDHAAHWERNLAFLRIATAFLRRSDEPDPESRQRRMVSRLADRWSSAPPDHPVFIAGSTGSRGTTLALMHAIAGLPQGGVVLPGYDFDLPPHVMERLAAGPMPAEDHPQYRFARLLKTLGADPHHIRRWTDVSPPNPARNRLVSLSLRPAPLTDQWMAEGEQIDRLDTALADVALIEAPDPRAEATAIALALREAAENGIPSALITPDRVLGRRVTAALDRWGIVPDDSAGEPLSQTPPGRLLRQVAGLFGPRPTAGSLLALMKHPLVATGGPGRARGPHLLHTRELELHLRRKGPAFPSGADIAGWARQSGETARLAWAGWIAPLIEAASDARDRELGDWTSVLVQLAECLAAGPGTPGSGRLWAESAGRSARSHMDLLMREAAHGGVYTAEAFKTLLRAHLSSEANRVTDGAHPLVAIWGTLEARVQGAELVILGSLNEGTWPQQPAPDPWLSRQMRLQTGLLLPERRIGLSAHDYQQAMGARRVILSRAGRDAEAETVPSRWLARLTNLLGGLADAGGPAGLERMRCAGRRYLALARDAEAVKERTPPAARPSPRPPPAARPKRLSVTRIEELLVDPYAVYARHVLRLVPLESLLPEPDARLRGEVLHRLIENFVRNRNPDESETQMRARFWAGIDTVLAEDVAWPFARRLWRARILRSSGPFLSSEQSRARVGKPVLLEEGGSIELVPVTFTLTARPDRIDLLDDGGIHIFDYKSGTPPKPADVKRYRKQLLLEAAMATHGAFPTIGSARVAAATYVQIGGQGLCTEVPLDDVRSGKVWDDLHGLIAHYQRPESGFVARLLNIRTRYPGDFDGISRYGEWDMHDIPVCEDME